MTNLPLPGDPLITMNGPVQPVEGDEDVSQNYQSREVLPRFEGFNPVHRIGLKEVPEKDAQEQTLIAAVIGLRLLGLDISDVAMMFNTGIQNIKDIINRPSTQVTFEKIFMSIINAKADHISGRIASHADAAVNKIVTLMDDEKAPAIVQLKAAQDILDRSGTGADQLFGINNKTQQEDELKITYVTKDGEQEKLNVTFKRK